MIEIRTDLISAKGVAVLLSVLLLMAVPVSGQSGGVYELSWYSIDGGAGESNGGPYTLTGTIGQPDATATGGGDYELFGGFWPGGTIYKVGIVDFHHFARFAEWWLETDCNAGNNWCDGADLNHLDGVDEVDLDLFVDEWLRCCPLGWPLIQE